MGVQLQGLLSPACAASQAIPLLPNLFLCSARPEVEPAEEQDTQMVTQDVGDGL